MSSNLQALRDTYVAAIDDWVAAIRLSSLPGIDRAKAQPLLKSLRIRASAVYYSIIKKEHDQPPAPAPAPAGVADASSHDCGAAHTEKPVVTAETPAVAATSDASDHDCGAAHRPEKVLEVAPAPAPAPSPAPEQEDYARAREWFTKCGYPQSQIDRMIQVWRANDISQEDGRVKELELGSWATLPNKKRIMVFKGHAFEPPTDRYYGVPGPLKHLGFYDRGDFPGAKGRIVPSDDVPVIPQTRETYPWWTPAADRFA